jgi:8-oxo-dGTP pyrophosphatase MutT (NUDIX family)
MKALPSDASTVMLLRLRDDGGIKDIEVLMVRRNRKSSFVPGYYVFPGGVAEKSDCDAGMRQFIRGLDGVSASRMSADTQNADNVPGAWVAGIRETFEEVGILLAERRDGSPVSIQTENDRRRFCDYRKALIENKMRFAQMLAAEDLVLPLDRLHYFSRWITPEPFPLRYDVRFFVAEAPSNQVAIHDDIEITGHVWLRPAEALRRYEQGKLDMVLPQIMTLEEIKHFRTIREVIDFARKRHIPATLTKIKRIGGKDVEVMPDGSVFENRPPVYAWPDKEG